MNNPDTTSTVQILKTIAHVRLQPDAPDLPPASEARDLLAHAFGPLPPTPPSEADLARIALDLLAANPAFSGPVAIMVRQAATGVLPTNQRYLDPATGIALTTAALLVLQTRIKFKRTTTGKWSLDIDKAALSDATLKLLVQHLLALLGQPHSQKSAD